jgi:hypothetical protein
MLLFPVSGRSQNIRSYLRPSEVKKQFSVRSCIIPAACQLVSLLAMGKKRFANNC